MLLNESSIADLNTRIEKPVSVLNFRPNFLVKGPAAFEEDHWKWVKIGEEVIFRCNKPCTRYASIFEMWRRNYRQFLILDVFLQILIRKLHKEALMVIL